METAPFIQHRQIVPLREIIAPRAVSVSPVRLSFDSSSREAIDAFADMALARERQRKADIAAESQTEGRSFPSRVDRDNA